MYSLYLCGLTSQQSTQTSSAPIVLITLAITFASSLLSPLSNTLPSTSIGSTLWMQTESMTFIISPKSLARALGLRALESLMPIPRKRVIFDSRIPIPATTRGPTMEPRPASSTPPTRMLLPCHNKIVDWCIHLGVFILLLVLAKERYSLFCAVINNVLMQSFDMAEFVRAVEGK